MRLNGVLNRIVGLIIIILGSYSVDGQINLESGFQYLSLQDQDLNSIVKAHNDQYPDYKKELSEPNGMFGALFGIRYRQRSFATHLTWNFFLQSLKANGGDQSIDRRISLNLQTLSWALIPMITDNVGIGLSITGSKWSIKNSEDDIKLDKLYLLGHQMFIEWHLGSPDLAQLVIRPFVEYRYKPLTAKLFAQDLGVDDYHPPEKKWFLGISLIILNGPK